MASTTTLSSPQDSDAWALLALKDATASPARQHRDPIPCEAMEDSINNVVSESICVSATVEIMPSVTRMVEQIVLQIL